MSILLLFQLFIFSVEVKNDSGICFLKCGMQLYMAGVLWAPPVFGITIAGFNFAFNIYNREFTFVYFYNNFVIISL